MRNALRKFKDEFNNYDDGQRLVRLITCNTDAIPTTEQLQQLTNVCSNDMTSTPAYQSLWFRLSDYQNLRHVEKSLIVVEHLLIHGTRKFQRHAKLKVTQFRKLTGYVYKVDGSDIGQNVRRRANNIYRLLSNEKMLEERRNVVYEQKHNKKIKFQTVDSYYSEFGIEYNDQHVKRKKKKKHAISSSVNTLNLNEIIDEENKKKIESKKTLKIKKNRIKKIPKMKKHKSSAFSGENLVIAKPVSTKRRKKINHSENNSPVNDDIFNANTKDIWLTKNTQNNALPVDPFSNANQINAMQKTLSDTTFDVWNDFNSNAFKVNVEVVDIFDVPNNAVFDGNVNNDDGGIFSFNSNDNSGIPLALLKSRSVPEQQLRIQQRDDGQSKVGGGGYHVTNRSGGTADDPFNLSGFDDLFSTVNKVKDAALMNGNGSKVVSNAVMNDRRRRMEEEQARIKRVNEMKVRKKKVVNNDPFQNFGDSFGDSTSATVNNNDPWAF